MATMQRLLVSLTLMLVVTLTFAAEPPSTNRASTLVFLGPDGQLNYKPYTDRGDGIPDFSRCGYGGGGIELPSVPVAVTISPQPESTDDTKRIQAALDRVAKLPVNKNSFRGAV